MGKIACMPPPTAAAARQKKTSDSPGKAQRRPHSGASRPQAGRRPGGWRVWTIIAAVVVFLAAYILDPGAVARLIAACLAGQFGPRVRIAVFAALALVGCVLAWALLRPQPRRSAAAVSKPRRRRSPAKAKPAPTGPEEAAPAESSLMPDQASPPRAPGRRASSGRPAGRS